MYLSLLTLLYELIFIINIALAWNFHLNLHKI